MTLETVEARKARARREFDDLSDAVLLTEPEAAGIFGESTLTWKDRRLSGSGKGPAAVFLIGRVRYEVSELRRWRASRLRRDNSERIETRRKAREARERADAEKLGL